MGCDIHLVLERRHNGKWIGVDTFPGHHGAHPAPDAIMDGWSSPTARSRNYRRFAELAAVRGDGPEPLGIPEDVSDTARLMIDDWGGDGHSHSWLSMIDAARIFLETEWIAPGAVLSDFIKKYPESHYFNIDCSEGSGKDASDYRVVFWFDN